MYIPCIPYMTYHLLTTIIALFNKTCNVPKPPNLVGILAVLVIVSLTLPSMYEKQINVKIVNYGMHWLHKNTNTILDQ